MIEETEDIKTDILPDISVFNSKDRCEDAATMEPMTISEGSRFRRELTDAALELATLSAGFNRSPFPGTAAALSDLVRSMNCYYSNLIEGHNTHPVDIEKALKAEFSKEPEKRNLQLEAR